MAVIDAAKAVAGEIAAALLAGVTGLIGWAISLEYRVRAVRSALRVQAASHKAALEAQAKLLEGRDARIYDELKYIRGRLDRALDGD